MTGVKARTLRLIGDGWDRVAVFCCCIPLAAMVMHARPYLGYDDLSQNSVELIIWFTALPFDIVMLSWPQILMSVAVRRADKTRSKVIGCVASAALGTWYAGWAAGADLSGSSTASLALIFYPIMVQGWAWLAAYAAVFLSERIDGRSNPPTF